MAHDLLRLIVVSVQDFLVLLIGYCMAQKSMGILMLINILTETENFYHDYIVCDENDQDIGVFCDFVMQKGKVYVLLFLLLLTCFF